MRHAADPDVPQVTIGKWTLPCHRCTSQVVPRQATARMDKLLISPTRWPLQTSSRGLRSTRLHSRPVTLSGSKPRADFCPLHIRNSSPGTPSPPTPPAWSHATHQQRPVWQPHCLFAPGKTTVRGSVLHPSTTHHHPVHALACTNPSSCRRPSHFAAAPHLPAHASQTVEQLLLPTKRCPALSTLRLCCKPICRRRHSRHGTCQAALSGCRTPPCLLRALGHIAALLMSALPPPPCTCEAEP